MITPVTTAIPSVEYAVALAAWVSIHWLRPVPFEDDGIAKVIAWRSDADSIEESCDGLMPTSPREYLDCCPEIIEAADAVLPSGNAKGLGRYHFFEAMADPSATDPGQLISATSKCVAERLLPGAEDRAIAFGPYILGPFGIIETQAADKISPCSEWDSQSPRVVSGSLASYVQVICDYRGNEQYLDNLPEFRLSGWSKSWHDWCRKHGPIDTEPDDVLPPDGVSALQKLSFRSEWAPPRQNSPDDPGDQLLTGWPDEAYRQVCGLKATALRKILASCLEYERKRMFEGVGGGAREAAKILAGPLEDVPVGVLRQLLQLVTPEVAVSAAMELGCGSFTPTWGDFTFGEYLTAALLRAYSMADCKSMLVGFMARAGGTDVDRVLHYIVKHDPSKVLRSQLSANPLVASALARVTCAPLRFHSLDQWDPSDPSQVDLLCKHAGSVLGEERPPSPPGRAMPFTPPSIKVLTSQEALDYINRGRRRPEYLVKTAIQYIYALQSHLQSPHECQWRRGRLEVATAGFFWLDKDFVTQIAGRAKCPKGDPLVVPENARLQLSDLLQVLGAAGKLIQHDSPPFLKAVRDAQRAFKDAIEKWDVYSSGNLGSHDNSTDWEDLSKALDSLTQFDANARAIDDALPPLVVFKEMVRQPNRPNLVRVEPYEPLGMMHAQAKMEHHITDPGLSFRGDRVYSFTDVTRNQVSINPIMLDWNEWLAWSGLRDKKPG